MESTFFRDFVNVESSELYMIIDDTYIWKSLILR